MFDAAVGFEPHLMYSPTGQAVKANTMADHLRYESLGYTHSPLMNGAAGAAAGAAAGGSAGGSAGEFLDEFKQVSQGIAAYNLAIFGVGAFVLYKIFAK